MWSVPPPLDVTVPMSYPPVLLLAVGPLHSGPDTCLSVSTCLAVPTCLSVVTCLAVPLVRDVPREGKRRQEDITLRLRDIRLWSFVSCVFLYGMTIFFFFFFTPNKLKR